IITPDPINQYAEDFTSPESAALKKLNQLTHENVRGAQMLSGHLQGMILQMLSQMMRPGLILELGTYTGYSAICLAKGLKAGGMLHTVDIDDSLQELRATYWKAEGLEDRIVQHTGEAAGIIDRIGGPIDLVFLVADKKNYGLYFDLLMDKMPAGGVILADNVLYDGEVILPTDQQSKTAGYIHAFNQKVAADDRVEQVIMPVRDGL